MLKVKNSSDILVNSSDCCVFDFFLGFLVLTLFLTKVVTMLYFIYVTFSLYGIQL